MRGRRLVFTGDGKGKTTAAMGMACRALGHGLPVLVAQFIKGRDTGEEKLLAAQPGLTFLQLGLGFLPRTEGPELARHRAAAQDGLQRVATELVAGQWRLVVLDEICTAVARGLLAEAAVLAALERAQPETVIVLTGRGATSGLIAYADTVTEMRCVKHGYATGIAAQPGVEW